MSDDELKEFDLSAWEAPEPPADLADGVIARLAGTDVSAVVAVEPAKPQRRAWLVAGVAAAAIGVTVGTYALISSARREAPSSGGVVAQQARSLSLEGIRADLDAGTDVRWRRTGDVTYVEQRAGKAAWRVDSSAKLVIDAGATVASVEATGASLRVEVEMNLMDAKVLGASALTSAVVAAITVVVYEGHVKVTGGGQPTVVVQPGSTYRVTPPGTPELDEDPVVAGTPDIDDPDLETVASCDEVSCVLDNYAGPCCAKYKKGSASCDHEKLRDRGLEKWNLRQHAAALADFEAALRCKPNDSYLNQLAFMGACGTNDSTKAKLYYKELTPAQQQRFAQMCIRTKTAYVDSKACDADALKDEGMEAVNMGQHDEALAKFEASLSCKQDGYVVQLAFMASCSAENPAKAKLYYKKLTRAQQSRFKVMCERNKVEYQDAIAMPDDAVRAKACDADAAKEKGMENINMGQHAAALAQFEASLRCKDDPSVRPLAFMASCNSGNEAKAKYYYAKLTGAEQQKFAAICIRNKVAYEGGAASSNEGYVQAHTTPSGLQVLVDGKDTGLTTPVTGTQLPLAPGKHKITFVVRGSRFTYPVDIAPGATRVLRKDLE